MKSTPSDPAQLITGSTRVFMVLGDPVAQVKAPVVDSCDTAAAVSGSVNAVRRNADGSLHGGLFDGMGFVRALEHFGFAPRGRSVLLLGAGGAGAAIAVGLAEAGPRHIALHDLGDRAAALADPLLEACRARGIDAHPGLEMLVQQVPVYLEFFGLYDVAQALRGDLSEPRALIDAE